MNRQAGKQDEGLRYKQKKIVEHMGLINLMMQRMQEYIPKDMPREDVLQYGYIGLVEAMTRYEESKGKFSTFACIRIYGSIIDGIFQFLGVKRCRKTSKLSLEKLQRLSSAVKIDDQFIWKYDVKTDDRFEQIGIHWVKTRKGLVQDQKLGIGKKRDHKLDLLLITLGAGTA